jgi:hypothetical protein
MCKPSQGRRWFETKSTIHPRTLETLKYSHGLLCWVCGKVREAFPLLSVEAILEKLADAGQVQFHVRWDAAKNRLEFMKDTVGDEPFKVTILHTQLTGLRIEFPKAFVQDTSFSEHFGVPCDDKGLKLKVITVTDSELTKHTGVLLDPAEIPATLPHSKAVLYHDEHTSKIEIVLDKCEALHSKHASDLMKYQTALDMEDRGIGLSMKHTMQAPRYSEIKKAADIVQDDRRREAEERDKELALADAAASAALRGDSAAKRALERAAAVGSIESSSRLRRPREEEDDDAQQSQKRPRAGPPLSGAAASAPSRPVRGSKQARGRGGGRGGRSACEQFRSAAFDITPQGKSRLTSAGSVASAAGTQASGNKNSSHEVYSVDGDAPKAPDDLQDLLAFIMGPKNYSPGREIRWVGR